MLEWGWRASESTTDAVAKMFDSAAAEVSILWFGPDMTKEGAHLCPKLGRVNKPRDKCPGLIDGLEIDERRFLRLNSEATGVVLACRRTRTGWTMTDARI